jgi:hypothetical protein
MTQYLFEDTFHTGSVDLQPIISFSVSGTEAISSNRHTYRECLLLLLEGQNNSYYRPHPEIKDEKALGFSPPPPKGEGSKTGWHFDYGETDSLLKLKLSCD